MATAVGVVEIASIAGAMTRAAVAAFAFFNVTEGEARARFFEGVSSPATPPAPSAGPFETATQEQMFAAPISGGGATLFWTERTSSSKRSCKIANASSATAFCSRVPAAISAAAAGSRGPADNLAGGAEHLTDV